MKANKWYEVDSYSNDKKTLQKRSWHMQIRDAMLQGRRESLNYPYVTVKLVMGEMDTRIGLFNCNYWGQMASFTDGRKRL